MTELSPQAQAVLGAAINDAAGILNDSDSEWVRGYANQIAAALRAAAYTIDWESGDPKFLLENVATELESQ